MSKWRKMLTKEKGYLFGITVINERNEKKVTLTANSSVFSMNKSVAFYMNKKSN